MNTTNTTLLDALVCRGVLISVSVRYWRARRKLNPEDLGLKRNQVNDRLISLGHKRLLPKECLQQLALVEGRAHALCEENTFPFLNGVARYLPNTRLEEVTAKLRDLQADFEQARQEFMRQYAGYRGQAVDEWREQATRLGADPRKLAAVIEDAFPAPDRMDRYFGFAVNLFQVSVPEAPTVQMVDLGTQQELIEARRQAAAAARTEIEQSCRSFIADCTATLREQAAKLCSEILETIRSTGSVHQKTLNRLVNFIDRFGELNFMNDREMASQLDAVRREFLTQTAAEYRDSDTSRRRLVKGLTALRETATEMAQADKHAIIENFGQVGRRRFQLAA